MTYETIVVETPAAGVGLVRLNRPQALNALNSQLTREIFEALEAFDATRLGQIKAATFSPQGLGVHRTIGQFRAVNFDRRADRDSRTFTFNDRALFDVNDFAADLPITDQVGRRGQRLDLGDELDVAAIDVGVGVRRRGADFDLSRPD